MTINHAFDSSQCNDPQHYNFIAKMKNKRGVGPNNYRDFFTDTSLTSFGNKSEYQRVDKNVYNAIKQNDVKYLVGKEGEDNVGLDYQYDENKEMLGVITQIRRKYDLTKIESSKFEGNISHLEKEKELLLLQLEKLKQETVGVHMEHEETQEKHRSYEEIVAYHEHYRDVRRHMVDVLKKDILHYKKISFDKNILLIRLKTHAKQLSQRFENKRHVKSKCKVILQTLQSTVKMRQNERKEHLSQVETVLMRKMQNSQLRDNRDHQLQMAMYRAEIERLPEQKQLINKYFAEAVLKKMLKIKMNKLMESNKSIEDAFRQVKKHTKVKTIGEFVDSYLQRQSKYGDLLDSINRNEARIAEVKEQQQQLKKQQERLLYQEAEIHEQLQHMNKIHEPKDAGKKVSYYNVLAVKDTQLMIMLQRWTTKFLFSFNNVKNIAGKRHHATEEAFTLNKSQIKANLLNVFAIINSVLQQKAEEAEDIFTNKPSQVSTHANEPKIRLGTLRSQSVLSDEYSRRNYRIHTLLAHQDAHESREEVCDDISQHNYLRYNRRMVKKHNMNSIRARIKTKHY